MNWTQPDRPVASSRLLRKALAEAGATFNDVVRTRIFLAHAEDWEAVGRVHGEFFGSIRPASTMVVASLLSPKWRIEIEMEAVDPQSQPQSLVP